MSYIAKWASLYAPLCCIWYTQTEQVSFGFKLRLCTWQLRRCNGGKTSLMVAEKKNTSDRRCNHRTSCGSACASTTSTVIATPIRGVLLFCHHERSLATIAPPQLPRA